MPKAAAQVRLMCLERSRPNGAGLSASPPTTPSASSSLHAPPPAVQRRQALLCPPHHRPPRHCRLLRPPAPVHLRLLHRRRRRRRRVRCRRRLRLRPSPHRRLPDNSSPAHIRPYQCRSRRSHTRPVSNPAVSQASLPALPAFPRRIAPLDGLSEPARLRGCLPAATASPNVAFYTNNGHRSLHRRQLRYQLPGGPCRSSQGCINGREGEGTAAINCKVGELSECSRLFIHQVSSPSTIAFSYTRRLLCSWAATYFSLTLNSSVPCMSV